MRKSQHFLDRRHNLDLCRTKEAVHTRPEDLYRKHCFEAFDTVINCIEDRFDHKDFKMYALLEQVLLKAAKQDEYEEELKKVIQLSLVEILIGKNSHKFEWILENCKILVQ